VISRALLAQAVGTTATLNLDGLAMTSDGTLIVSFKNAPSSTFVGTGNRIRNPLNGNIGAAITIYGSDILAIPQPVGDRARRPSLAFGRPQHDRRPIRVLEHHGSPRLRPATERGFDFEPLRPPRWLGVRNPPAPRVFTVRIGRRDLHQPRGQSRRIHQHVVGRSGHVRRPARRSPRTGSTNRVALDALALSPYLRFPRGSAITVGVTDAAGTPIGPALRRGQSVPLRFTRAESSRTAPTARCARLHLVGTSLSTAFGYPFVTGGFGHRGPEPNDPFLLATDHRRLRPRS
jgi:hypothetical protein